MQDVGIKRNRWEYGRRCRVASSGGSVRFASATLHCFVHSLRAVVLHSHGCYARLCWAVSCYARLYLAVLGYAALPLLYCGYISRPECSGCSPSFTHCTL